MLNIIKKITNEKFPIEIIDMIYIYHTEYCNEDIIYKRIKESNNHIKNEILKRLNLENLTDKMYYTILKEYGEYIKYDKTMNDIDKLCIYNCVEILKKKYNTDGKLDVSYWGINRAIENDVFEVLNYLWECFGTHNKLYNMLLTYKIDLLTSIKMIEWFYEKSTKYGIDFRYTETLIDNNSKYGNIKVLDWFYKKWKDDGIRFLYTKSAVDNASTYGHVDILDWFWDKKDELEFKYSYMSIDRACQNHNKEVILWFLQKEGRIPLKYSKWAIFWMKKGNNKEFIEFIESSIKNIKINF